MWLPKLDTKWKVVLSFNILEDLTVSITIELPTTLSTNKYIINTPYTNTVHPLIPTLLCEELFDVEEWFHVEEWLNIFKCVAIVGKSVIFVVVIVFVNVVIVNIIVSIADDICFIAIRLIPTNVILV